MSDNCLRRYFRSLLIDSSQKIRFNQFLPYPHQEQFRGPGSRGAEAEGEDEIEDGKAYHTMADHPSRASPESLAHPSAAAAGGAARARRRRTAAPIISLQKIKIKILNHHAVRAGGLN
jgi:hypothetical protein